MLKYLIISLMFFYGCTAKRLAVYDKYKFWYNVNYKQHQDTGYFILSTCDSVVSGSKFSVYDSKTNVPLIGANILLNRYDSVRMGNVTDVDGNSEIKLDIDAIRSLNISYFGYNNLVIPIDKLSSKNCNYLKIYLSEDNFNKNYLLRCKNKHTENEKIEILRGLVENKIIKDSCDCIIQIVL